MLIYVEESCDCQIGKASGAENFKNPCKTESIISRQGKGRERKKKMIVLTKNRDLGNSIVVSHSFSSPQFFFLHIQVREKKCLSETCLHLAFGNSKTETLFNHEK